MPISPPPRRLWAPALLTLLALALLGLVAFWKHVADHGGQGYAEPFRIAGNLYYVGADDAASFLLTGPEGHVLLDGGYPGTADMIEASIRELGFDPADVRILLNTHFHLDHAGGLAGLQEATGAELRISEPEADAVATGGDEPGMGALRALVWAGPARYPRPRVDRRFQDGDTVRLGPLELTAHLTPGHTPGCTTWTFPVRAGDRELLAGLACGVGFPTRVPVLGLGGYPGYEADYARSLETWRSLPVDVFLAPHARTFGRYRKYRESLEAEDPVAPWVDPEGWRAFVEAMAARFEGAHRS